MPMQKSDVSSNEARSFIRIIPLMPLPFLLFHLFLFSLWYYWRLALEIPVLIVAPIILIIFMRMLLYFPLSALSLVIGNSRFENYPVKNIFSAKGFLEIVVWYSITALGYWHLKVRFLFPSSIGDGDTSAALILGYLGYFVFCFVFVVPSVLLAKSLKQIFVKMQERVGLLRRSCIILVTYLLLNIIFAAIYRFIDLNSTSAFNRQLDGFWEAMYFSVITAATVGYGDITPTNVFTKTFVSLEILIGMTLLTVVLSTVISMSLEEKVKRNFENKE